MIFTRRRFLHCLLPVVGTGLALPKMLMGALLSRSAGAAPGGARFLVLLRLYGGNDGLNTVIPYTSGLYRDNRPTLRVDEGDVLPLDAAVGLHPSLAPLLPHWQAGRLAVVQGVGYPAPDLSHFRSEEIWMSADPVGTTPTGWLGRYLDQAYPPPDGLVRAVQVSYDLDLVLRAETAGVFVFPDLGNISFPTDGQSEGDIALKRAAFDAASGAARTPGSPAAELARGGLVLSENMDLYAAVPDTVAAPYPDTRLGADLRTLSRMIRASDGGSLGAGIFQAGIGGFDTHSSQDDEGGHPALLAEIAGALAAFHADLAAAGIADRVLVLTYSEFGRRVEENGSKGTDHGTAAPLFAFGNPVTGGLYGPAPDLADLDDDGNLRHAIDFREVYSTVLSRWLDADPAAILGGTFAPVPFLP